MIHADAFDRYREGNSLLHLLDPRVKVAITVLYILSNAVLPDGAWAAFGIAWGLLLLGNAISGLGAGFTLRQSFIALPFALIALSTLFSVPGAPVAALQIGSLSLVITGAGLLRFTSILARSWLSVQMAILLVATTQFPDLMHALRHLRLPDVLVSVISFMYRYLFVLVDEAMRLLRGREARLARLPGKRSGGSIGWRARVAGNLAGQLFLRSLERADRVYQAMMARGFQGQLLTLNPHQMSQTDWIAGGLAMAALLAIQVTGRL
ncbi:MAG: cobalt ECF transporter T component CbiQ [Chloroflexota bacterium]|nr:MAG: cobalt ECF transporter T component CbiQ [Chloroflexota bacterium]